MARPRRTAGASDLIRVIGDAINEQPAKRRLVGIVAILFLTQSRSGMVAFGAVTLLCLWMSRSPRLALRFAIALIPHTLAVTTLGRWGVGDAVNIEVDILAKHVEKLLEGVQGRWAT